LHLCLIYLYTNTQDKSLYPEIEVFKWFPKHLILIVNILYISIYLME